MITAAYSGLCCKDFEIGREFHISSFKRMQGGERQFIPIGAEIRFDIVRSERATDNRLLTARW